MNKLITTHVLIQGLPSSEPAPSNDSRPLDIPKEAYRLVDHIYKHGMDQVSYFNVELFDNYIYCINKNLWHFSVQSKVLRKLLYGTLRKVPGHVMNKCMGLMTVETHKNAREPKVAYEL